MPHLVVLSNFSQYEAFLKKGCDLAKFRVFCDNTRFYNSLEQKGIPYEALDEFEIQDRWKKINEWGCQAACGWIRSSRGGGFFKGIDFPSVVYHLFSRVLIQMLKNFSYAKLLMERCRPSTIVVFETALRPSFPDFYGNRFLNHFIERQAMKKGMLVEKISVIGEKAPEYVPNYFSKITRLIRWSRSRSKRMMEKSYGTWVKPNLGGAFLAYGSLKHLGPVIQALKKKGGKVVLYEPEFHQSQREFARREGIPYLISACFPNRSFVSPQQWIQEAHAAILQSLDEAIQRGNFVFEEEDFGPFVKEEIFATLKDWLAPLASRFNDCENVLGAKKILGVLVDDDFGHKGGFWAAFCRMKGIPVYCVSHANLAVDFCVPPKSRGFNQSTTFVHSEFEKKFYEARGWEGSQIVVTGAPRYDRLFGWSHPSTKKRSKGPFKLLLCATSLWPHSPNQRGYLGSNIATYSGVQMPASRAILETVKNYPLQLMIKPHSLEPVPLWERLVKEMKMQNQVVITRASDDIFKLYQECDAMILSYWSTALIETALLRLPTIFVDLCGLYGDSLNDFASQGFCQLVRSQEALERTLRELCLKKQPPMQLELSEEVREYYLGKREGNAASRVAETILDGKNEQEKRNSRSNRPLLPR